ncbi:FG-GAP repeat domain-containing protein [Solirubrobacter pauli]|uniref:FG-GAP repeat domain-containing protein n=1 Tax=Solirubrobacter pauli TaxID=166793 RepID=UPI0014777BAF|nr:VCBS repeat-containing protein [Solirubrobacter pauli]
MLAVIALPSAAHAAKPRFTPVASFGDAVRELRVADVNQDGIGDLVVGSVCRATVLLGGGDGTYSEFQRLSNPGICEDAARGRLAVGDVDGDKRPDVILGRNDNNHVWVFTRTSSGAFVDTPRAISMVAGGASANTTPGRIATGDLNGDGRDDLIVLITSFDDAGLHVLLANPTGFDPLVRYGLSGTSYQSLAVGRVDANGTPDVIVGGRDCATCADGVKVFTGNGDGTLTPGPASPSRGPVLNVLTAQLRTPGRDDAIVVTGRTPQSLLAGDGGAFSAGAITTGLEFPPPGGWATGTAGDVDGDGRTDAVVVGGSSGPSVDVLFGNGAGGFAAERPYDLGDQSPSGPLSDVGVTDADRDGDLDILAVAPDKRSVYLLRNEPAVLTFDNPTGFKSTVVGATSESRELGYPNYGLRPLAMPKPVVDGPFAITADTCSGQTLALTAHCQLTVVFRPTAAGAASGSVTLPGLSRTPLFGTGVADKTKPKATATVRKQKLKTVLSRGLKVTATCDEACTIKASLRLKSKEVGKRTVRLTTASKALTLKLSKAAKKTLKQAKSAKFTLRLTATDAAGNTRTTTKTITLRR